MKRKKKLYSKSCHADPFETPLISSILGACRLPKSKEKRVESRIRRPSPRERAQDTRNSSQDTRKASSQHYNTNECDTQSKAECTERCFRRASPG